MRTFSMILCLLISASVGLAQTRRINHRSHGGSPETFALMMEEDHLGWNPAMDPIYEVEPFVERIRKHYEEIAKQTPALKAEAPARDQPSVDPVAKDSIPNKVPNPAPISPQPKSSKNPKSPKTADVPADIPSPGFLVQEMMKANPSGEAVDSESPRKSGLWMLLGLLVFPVAPGIFVASAVAGRKRKGA